MNRPVVLITGAGGGVGAAAAETFAARGYDVALLDLHHETLSRVAARVESQGGRALVLCGDVCDWSFAEEATARVQRELGSLDVLINNAAWRELVTMRGITLESWRKTLDVCLTAPAFLARWCAALMEPKGGGVILNVSSINAFQASGASPAYAAAKGGLDALTYELAVLYGPRGIRVVGASFGAIETEMSRDMTVQAANQGADALRQFAQEMIPLGQFASVDQAARALVMLAGEDAAYLHGTNVVLDGGWSHNHLPLSLRRQQFPEEYS